ncbi:hypothetical protein G6646_00180 [Polynucleobacter paneuropaeus]|nr:hypothetical protein [Polynucleobacter paneuropaeus]QWD09504.1 hypothetical protein G6713_01775 [Polynucleobacter paneuropaeus]
MNIIMLNHNYEGFGTWHRCFKYAKALAEDHNVTMVCASGKKFDLKIRKKKLIM